MAFLSWLWEKRFVDCPFIHQSAELRNPQFELCAADALQGKKRARSCCQSRA